MTIRADCVCVHMDGRRHQSPDCHAHPDPASKPVGRTSPEQCVVYGCTAPQATLGPCQEHLDESIAEEERRSIEASERIAELETETAELRAQIERMRLARGPLMVSMSAENNLLRAEVERLREDADHTSCVESYTALRLWPDALVADLRGLADEWVNGPGLALEWNVPIGETFAKSVRAVLDKHAGEQTQG